MSLKQLGLALRILSKKRGQLTWLTNEKEQMDTQLRSQGVVPHMTQVPWRFDGRTNKGATELFIDGQHYYKGYGNPGSANNNECNNCLIDSMRQCLGLECDRKLVRQDLLHMYGGADGRANVTEMSFLDVENHGREIIKSLYRHNTSGVQSECSIAEFCIIALYANNEGNGNVVGHLTAPNHLVVLHTSMFISIHVCRCNAVCLSAV